MSSDADRNLLFGVLALQLELIDSRQFADACSGWAARKDGALADLLVDCGWITPADRNDVERLLDRKLRRHAGDAHASLAEAADERIRGVLAEVEAPRVRRTIDDLPRADGHVLISTIGYTPESRERYTLTRLHARGGLGQVWLAKDADLGRDVALKELRPERSGDPAVWARFMEEAMITGQLEHPNIVPVHELIRPAEGRAPFYTMRFVRGRTLAEAARAYHEARRAGQAGTLDAVALLNAFVGVCNAVAYAHSRGVIHRDLKPSNVVLGDYGEVVVLDWGLAKLVGGPEGTSASALRVGHESGRGETIAGQVLGTPAYMAPEQAEGRLDAIERRADVYGLGAILYEILAGRPPFVGSDTTELLRQVVHEPPERPRAANPDAPKPLEAVCLKALAKDPAARYDSAMELAEEVRHHLADEPVRAYREPLARRLGRLARRNRTLAAGLATLLVTASAALAINNALIRRERDQADAARADALANFNIARSNTRRLAQQVVDERLYNVPGTESIRLDMAEWAKMVSLGMLQSRPTDIALRIDAGLDLERVADIELSMRMRNSAAIFWASSAIRLLADDRPVAEAVDLKDPPPVESVRPAHPDDLERLQALAKALDTLARILDDDGDPARAEGYARQAVDLLDKAGLADPSAPPRMRRSAARMLGNLALIQHHMGRLREARDSIARALALRDLIESGELAIRYFARQGMILRASGDAAGAARSLDEAIRVGRLWVAANPVRGRRYELAFALLEQARLLADDSSRRAAAPAALDEALALARPLAAGFPMIVDYRRLPAEILHARGLTRAALGQPEDAERDLRAALKESEDVGPWPLERARVARVLGDLGRLARDRGRPAEARELLRRAVALGEEAAHNCPSVQTIAKALERNRGDLDRLPVDPG
jgi:tetratricopeptide (TPR) repeat protein